MAFAKQSQATGTPLPTATKFALWQGLKKGVVLSAFMTTAVDDLVAVSTQPSRAVKVDYVVCNRLPAGQLEPGQSCRG